MATSEKFLGAGKMIITDKLTTVHVSSIEGEPDRAYSLDLFGGFCDAGKAFRTSVPGAYFLIGQKIFIPPPNLQPPMIVEFQGEQSDLVVAAYRHSGGLSFLYGIPVDKLMEWKPPAKKEDFKEESVLISIKIDNAAIEGVHEIKNTETHAIKDKFEELLPYIHSMQFKPNLKLEKLKDFERYKDPVKRKSLTFANMVRQVCGQGELRDRKSASALGKRVRDARESVAGGEAAAETWANLKNSLATNTFLEDAFLDEFEDRFFTLNVGDDGKPSEADIEEFKSLYR
jgi:hypothetical protein